MLDVDARLDYDEDIQIFLCENPRGKKYIVVKLCKSDEEIDEYLDEEFGEDVRVRYYSYNFCYRTCFKFHHGQDPNRLYKYTVRELIELTNPGFLRDDGTVHTNEVEAFIQLDSGYWSILDDPT